MKVALTLIVIIIGLWMTESEGRGLMGEIDGIG